MITSTVPANLYSGSGWAVATIVNNQVVAVQYISDAQDRMPTDDELRSALARVKTMPATIAAGRVADAAWAALEAAEAVEEDTEHLDAAFHRAAVKIRHGMMSGTEFCHTLDKKEIRRVQASYAA